MRSESLESIARRLEIVARLLAANLVKGEPTDKQVAMLNDAGFQPKEIAVILGKKPVTVRTSLHRARRRKRANA